MDKGTIIASIIGVGIIVATVIFTGGSGSGTSVPTPAPRQQQPQQQKQIRDGENVSIEDGTQIITIDAKGGYFPKKSVAKAGIPTVIRFNTVGTFDCSASVRIPSLDITKLLPANGATDIAIGTPQAGPLQGSCGMGMYPFEVAFE